MSLIKGLYHWAVVCGIDAPTPGGFADYPTPYQSATVFFAVIDLVAAVGLWLAAPWGAVVWLTSVISMMAVELLFPQIYGGRMWVVAIEFASARQPICGSRCWPRASSRREHVRMIDLETDVIIDFQQHYTPPELLKGDRNAVSVRLDENGNPNYLLNPLLADLAAHVRMMDRAGIDAGVLSCGAGFDQPDLAICRLINDRMKQAVDDHPGRFIGLAHVPALKPDGGGGRAEALRGRSRLSRRGDRLGAAGAGARRRGAAAVLARGRRSRALRLHPSAAAASSAGTRCMPTISAACWAGSSR